MRGLPGALTWPGADTPVHSHSVHLVHPHSVHLQLGNHPERTTGEPTNLLPLLSLVALQRFGGAGSSDAMGDFTRQSPGGMKAAQAALRRSGGRSRRAGAAPRGWAAAAALPNRRDGGGEQARRGALTLGTRPLADPTPQPRNFQNPWSRRSPPGSLTSE